MLRSKQKKKPLANCTTFTCNLFYDHRLMLPYIVLKYVNKILGNVKEYYGYVHDIDIALIRGAYKINGVKLVKVDSVTHQRDTTPFFA